MAKTAPEPKANGKNEALLAYISAESKAPESIPNSKAINIVAMALPLFSGFARSTVQANRVGELMPVEIPKKIAPIKNTT